MERGGGGVVAGIGGSGGGCGGCGGCSGCSGCSGVKFESVSSRQWGKKSKHFVAEPQLGWQLMGLLEGAHVRVVVVSLSPRIPITSIRQDRSDKRYIAAFSN